MKLLSFHQNRPQSECMVTRNDIPSFLRLIKGESVQFEYGCIDPQC